MDGGESFSLQGVSLALETVGERRSARPSASRQLQLLAAEMGAAWPQL